MRMPEVIISLLIFAIVTATVLNVAFSAIRNSKSSVEVSAVNLRMLETDRLIRECIHSISFPYWKSFELYEDAMKNEIGVKLKELNVDVLEIKIFSKGKKYFIQVMWQSGNKTVSTVDSISNFKIVD